MICMDLFKETFCKNRPTFTNHYSRPLAVLRIHNNAMPTERTTVAQDENNFLMFLFIFFLGSIASVIVLRCRKSIYKLIVLTENNH